MAKRHSTFALVGILTAAVIAMAPGALVAAHGDESTSGSGSPTTRKTEDGTTGSVTGSTDKPEKTGVHKSSETEKENETHPVSDDSSKTKAEQRLNAAKLRVCENRQKNVTTIMSNGVERAQKQIDLFSAITTRVENFYVKKGNLVANYDELTAAIASAKATTETDLAALKSASSFDCNADNPKGAVSSYKAAAEKVRQDLKAYRTAVKNLITAVKSAQGGEQ